jgi:hypothetical protein
LLILLNYFPDEDKSTLLFWRSNQHLLANISKLARKYLASLAMGVPMENAFSKSAYYG